MREAIFRNLPATRHRDFRALWGGTASSSVSLWTLLLANAYIVFKLSESSFWVGVATFAAMVPYFLAPIGGVISDKFERRILVQLTRVGAFGTTSVLFVLAVTGVLTVWMVVVMAFIQGLVRAIEIPADSALLPNVVPEEDRANAVSLQAMTQQGSRAAGPLLAGPFLATVGVAGAYAVAMVFAILAFTSMRQVRTTSRGGVAKVSDIVVNVREGLSYIRATPPVAAVFVLVVAHCSLTMSFDAMLPGFAETELHSPKSGLTVMNFGIGIGALVGTFLLSVFPGGTRRGRLFLLTAIASGLSPICMAVSMHVVPATFSAIFMGSSQAMFMAMSAVFIQAVVPDLVRGRVMSLYLMSAGGIMAVANLGFASGADAAGIPVLFIVPGTLFIAIVLASIATGPHLRAVYRTGRIGLAQA
jgi:MFS family permease